jgi:hypothetical protein
MKAKTKAELLADNKRLKGLILEKDNILLRVARETQGTDKLTIEIQRRISATLRPIMAAIAANF